MTVFSIKFWSGVAKLLFPVKIVGKENIPEGSAVLLCNHLSFMDPIYVLSLYPKQCAFLSKKEASEGKGPFKRLLRDCGCIPVDRENPSMESMMACMRTLRAGKKLMIFPEGTRNRTKTLDIQEIKGGAALFAVKAKSPLVPMILTRKPKLFRKTKLVIGKPFELDHFYGKTITDVEREEMDRIVREKLVSLQEEALQKGKKS